MTDTSGGGGDKLIELLRLVESVDFDILLSSSDEVYKALANEQRRHLILHLIEQDTAVPLSRLAMELVSQSNDVPLTEVTHSEQEQMRLNLEHEHLPRLADYGLLSWSHGEDMIEPLPSLDSTDCE
ncbi:DUF7344 domain-containing protein [Haladaptatus halobius]|uniref:DUF7344 domain-containing protein n=1 Tax=Haladaptatus halobius TaxID=2884875 RepID=UPI001D0BE16B|nr:hypothetical protein [Haladaptatus halobius]